MRFGPSEISPRRYAGAVLLHSRDGDQDNRLIAVERGQTG
jgi:hypothetical protein